MSDKNLIADQDFPVITVVMPVKNEEKFIAQTIHCILKQDYPKGKYEVIVADGMSTDGTREIVKEIAQTESLVKLRDNPKGLPSAGRNVGFRNGRGNIFIVIDGHCYIDNDKLFKSIIDCFKRSKADCLGRPQPLIAADENRMQKAIAVARSSRLGHSSRSYIYSNEEGFVSPVSMGAIYRREVFDKVGYVDESFDACEDVEFNYRVEKAGLKTFLSPKLAVHYFPRKTLPGLFKQLVRYGEGRFKFINKHSGVMNLDMLILPGSVLLIFLLLLSGLFIPLGLYIAMACLGLYLVLVVLYSIPLAAKNGIKYLPLLPLVFITIHSAIAYSFIRATIKYKLLLPVRRHSSAKTVSK